jgi:hypothetical protein
MQGLAGRRVDVAQRPVGPFSSLVRFPMLLHLRAGIFRPVPRRFGLDGLRCGDRRGTESAIECLSVAGWAPGSAGVLCRVNCPCSVLVAEDFGNAGWQEGIVFGTVV